MVAELRITHKYDDIITLPHPVSQRRAGMPIADRAAQFAPFAALTGYDGVIAETGRQTDAQIELDECEREMLNEKLLYLRSRLESQPQAAVTWFCPDAQKAGGAYVTSAGHLKRMDPVARTLLFTDGTVIPMDRIYRIVTDISD